MCVCIWQIKRGNKSDNAARALRHFKHKPIDIFIFNPPDAKCTVQWNVTERLTFYMESVSLSLVFWIERIEKYKNEVKRDVHSACNAHFWIAKMLIFGFNSVVLSLPLFRSAHFTEAALRRRWWQRQRQRRRPQPWTYTEFEIKWLKNRANLAHGHAHIVVNSQHFVDKIGTIFDWIFKTQIVPALICRIRFVLEFIRNKLWSCTVVYI